MEQYGGEAGADIVLRNCTGDIRYVGQDAVATDIARLSKAIEDVDVAEGFLPATSSGCFTVAAPNQHYESYESYLFAIARALRQEYRAVVESGLLLQIDCPDLPKAMHTTGWDDTAQRIGYQKYLELHVAALNEAVAGLPADRMRMHICWGNYEGPHHMDVGAHRGTAGGLRGHAGGHLVRGRQPQARARVGGLRQAEGSRQQGPGPRRRGREDQRAGTPAPGGPAHRRVADIVGRERVIAGTDCGFGAFAGFGAINPSIAWLKLGALAEGARLASARLWQ